MLLRRDSLCDQAICGDVTDEELEQDEDARCGHCPVLLLNQGMLSDKGRQIEIANQLLVAIEVGFKPDLEEWPCDQVHAVAIMRDERLKYSASKADTTK